MTGAPRLKRTTSPENERGALACTHSFCCSLCRDHERLGAAPCIVAIPKAALAMNLVRPLIFEDLKRNLHVGHTNHKSPGSQGIYEMLSPGPCAHGHNLFAMLFFNPGQTNCQVQLQTLPCSCNLQCSLDFACTGDSSDSANCTGRTTYKCPLLAEHRGSREGFEAGQAAIHVRTMLRF